MCTRGKCGKAASSPTVMKLFRSTETSMRIAAHCPRGGQKATSVPAPVSKVEAALSNATESNAAESEGANTAPHSTGSSHGSR